MAPKIYLLSWERVELMQPRGLSVLTKRVEGLFQAMVG
jgi:hypothetical protein